MRNITVAATQMACSWDIEANLANAEALVREAAGQGANLVLLQELFETPYFCIDQIARHNELAHPLEGHPWLPRFQTLARELNVVLPVSFFERAGQTQFNSIAIIDADGSLLGHYRKMHIPDGPGYTEKFYFSPGDLGFKVWDTQVGRIGVGICWDQWFPECARSMALMGAELLLYPTAIGSEPHDAGIDSRRHWQNTQRGHAAANVMPLIASNRIGTEHGEDSQITFYGSSFIAGPDGELVAEASRDERQILLASFDLNALAQKRRSWGVFRDRRPEYYGALTTLDGRA
ncbi:N-carbamoylputrescine amidase [Crenobacter sp. SG2305]|uniref:N-carbamoylputrescine amidase n=1 Tax=Crenobacter oryzisoli TaxID=3056844 RepID=UPI0025AB2263|nr:N-carbamoylputrescine amidase [Crenobacter sp. SG2305]MDN0084758.1 N-carbamoylputrescine amidase [Crenobacter sp. SG2305]